MSLGLEALKNTFFHAVTHPASIPNMLFNPSDTFRFFSDPKRNTQQILKDIDQEVRRETWIPKPSGYFPEALALHRIIMHIHNKPDAETTDKEKELYTWARESDQSYRVALKRLQHPNPYFRAYLPENC